MPSHCLGVGLIMGVREVARERIPKSYNNGGKVWGSLRRWRCGRGVRVDIIERHRISGLDIVK